MTRLCQIPIVILSMLLHLACEEKIKPSVLTSVDSKTIPQQESWNSHIVISDSGQIKAVVDAGYLKSYEFSRQTLMSEGVVARFYDEHGVQTSVLTSREAKVDEGTNNLEAIGNVLVVSSDSTKLRTERLFWDNRRQQVHSPEFVRINSPKEQLQGHGFESDQSLKNYKIFRVTGEATTK
jgi:LPS export ABC transporter protein LptC